LQLLLAGLQIFELTGSEAAFLHDVLGSRERVVRTGMPVIGKQQHNQ